MAQQRSTTYRLALAGALAAGLVTGCGGDDGNDRPVTSIPSVPTTSGATAAEPQGERKKRAARERADKSNAAAPSRGSGSQFDRAISRAVRRLPPSQRTRAMKQVTRAVFSRYGFRAPQVTVSSGGDVIRATMSERDACTALVTTEASLSSQLRQGIPWLRSARIVVSGGEPLAQYVRANCRPPQLPGGRGRIVLTARGTGFRETERFTVRSKRWTVEYINGSNRLHILVMKRGIPSGRSLQAAKRGPGRQTVTGAGTFTLHVATGGDWVVRVRDGA